VIYLADTDVCSAHLRNKFGIPRRFVQNTGKISISVITLGELLTWTKRSSPRFQHGLDELLTDLNVINIDRPIAELFGELRGQLLDVGTAFQRRAGTSSC
jgi:tRNA(fMet)-specific endonuclease VapC